MAAKKKTRGKKQNRTKAMAKRQSSERSNHKRPIETYEHKDKHRVNNPPVGLVTPDTDPDAGAKKTYAYDPHLDPQLQWAGKAEHTSFEVPTVSLHVHERIDPRAIIDAVKRKNGSKPQMGLFDSESTEPLRHAVEFYQHQHGWSNRLIAGDSLLVMNSLLQKEGMAGKMQMIYIDPPYGINYASNFQPFTNRRTVKDRDEDLTQEPETIRAFRDTWDLGIHSYLTYLRDRMRLAHELLGPSGSIFVQIGDGNVHLVRNLLDEVFGPDNFMSLISFRTKIPLGTKYLAGIADYLVWYGKEAAQIKFRRLFFPRAVGGDTQFTWVELPSGERRKMMPEERSDPDMLPSGARAFRLTDLVSSGRTETCVFDFEFDNRKFSPSGEKSWKTNPDGVKKLILSRRLMATGNMPAYVFFQDDYPVQELSNQWVDTQGASDKVYVVQTSTTAVQRCILMTTDPGDLVFDPTCGSGTTAYVAEQWGRRWITCDTSRVALALARQRLITAVFDYYQLAHPQEGVGSGFRYRNIPHVTLGSITNNPDIRAGMTRAQIDAAIARGAPQETLYDQPFVDNQKMRVSGPFTVEAVPAPAVKAVDNLLESAPQTADSSIARTGETLRQGEWRDELMRTGIRGKGGQNIGFARLEPLPGCSWLQADGETKEDKPQRIVVSFGPEHAPLEQRQVAQAIEEAQTLVPKPKLVVFAAFQFDPEAAKDIDETRWPGVTLLKAQMNADLLTEDLKKKRASNESFWLIGQPDVRIERIAKGEDKGKFVVSVHGFDYYNTKTGGIESGGEDKIAVWLLDTDYDGRSLYPRQVFFPMAGEKDGWARLAKNLKAEIDEERIDAYRGTVSLPFERGAHNRLAVKIVDDRGIESLKVMELP